MLCTPNEGNTCKYKSVHTDWLITSPRPEPGQRFSGPGLELSLNFTRHIETRPTFHRTSLGAWLTFGRTARSHGLASDSLSEEAGDPAGSEHRSAYPSQRVSCPILRETLQLKLDDRLPHKIGQLFVVLVFC